LKNPDQHTTYELGTLGGTSSLALNINNTGQVVGWAEDADGNRRPFLKNPGQSMQDLGTLGGNSGLAASINHRGQVVGRAKDGSGFERAFLWDQGVMYNLNDLTVNLPSGVILSAAWAINDQGWIAGDASNNAFLLMRVEGNAYLWLLLLD
jgi:probable HAF family extracellular repeat protein